MAQPASRITSDQRVVRTLTSHAASAVEESCKIQRAVEANVCWLNEFVESQKRKFAELLEEEGGAEGNGMDRQMNVGEKVQVVNGERKEEGKDQNRHPDDEIDVDELKVVQLRSLLKKRGLSTAGKKAELQVRLKDDIQKDREERARTVDKKESANIESSASGIVSNVNGMKRMSIEVMESIDDSAAAKIPDSTKSEDTAATAFFDSMDVDIEPELDNTDNMDSESKTKSSSPKQAAAIILDDKSKQIDIEIMTQKEPFKEKDVTSSTVPFDEMCKKSSSESHSDQRNIMKDTSNTGPGKKLNMSTSETSLSDSSSSKDVSSQISKSSADAKRSSVASVISISTTSTCSIANNTDRTSKNVSTTFCTENDKSITKQSTSSLKSTSSTSSIRSMVEAKQKEKLTKQQARLEEMRGKARTEVFSATKRKEMTEMSLKIQNLLHNRQAGSALKSSNKQNTNNSDRPRNKAMEKNDQHKRLIAQMRERAQGKLLSATKATVTKEDNSGLQNNTAQAIDNRIRRQIEQKAQREVEQIKSNQVKMEHKAAPRSPMDTYEISDREDSESESDSEDEYNKKPKKRIPQWARSANLIPALEKQYSEGPHRIDPDQIFPEVETCDLEKIFDGKKARYVRRTSSGNWNNDRVTIEEKLVYKRQMGYQRR